MLQFVLAEFTPRKCEQSVPVPRPHAATPVLLQGARAYLACYNLLLTVSIHTHLRSETIHQPAAAALVGKNVCIILVEEPARRPLRDLTPLDRLAGKIDLDFDAMEELRRRSVA